MSNENKGKELNVLILAAGLGTRMRSNLAKVLHKLDGRPLINHVCRTATALAPSKIFVVIGHQGEDVTAAVLDEIDPELVEFVVQEKQLGTGDAVNSARACLADEDSTLLVLSGDVPLIRAETLASLVQQHHDHRGKGAAATILTVALKDPSGYGRVVRDDGGFFDRIVEQKDAGENELSVKEINSGIYCFDTIKLFEALSRISNDNAQGEYYLTDAPRILRQAGESVSLYKHRDQREIEGINDRSQLAVMEREVRRRTINKLMLDYGVSFIDPKNVYVSARTSIGRDTVIHPNVVVEGDSVIGDGCELRSGTRIADSRLGNGVTVLDNCVITGAIVGNDCSIGPFAHLRPKACMADGSRVGNFVEMKNTTLGRRSKANHLTYLGDATIGEDTNIGAGTITCNYDGQNKHRTEIGDRVKIGSDTMLIAPIKVGNGVVTGAGTVANKDIPDNKLAVGAPARFIKTLANDGE
ncbi:MAG: bifunctional UDP-N-acetylglucosamine diphosphorylase/glucosamine-1-phosphate N-acetyltransferase GlmU [Acidobacteriota bacterium]|nr:bifunctional UDP-N-acetylglucosamine diphosphorylase/glucosamine-1-phosphate N-acetyltransferase GlmU [Acidobacteriota bacterium]MDH3528196.1 bifunctional UDP-N-acetylglucosamine diphosphorylase/glucosamine-1-phosphate N-acetyltransferase GlmU [Acidobacteriota bacterium]